MPNDQEIIEARLAAYVEGDLPPAGRTEIEKYLAANPQHAQLIKELQAQRTRLSALPRERAPAEVLDHLQSHLERSALLENVEEAAESMRIRRWPQLMAVAAMLLLAVGLGALVYQVLPSGSNPTQVTLAPPALQQLPSSPTLKSDALASRDEDAVRSGKSEARLSDGRPKDNHGRDFVEQMADQMVAASEQAKQGSVPEAASLKQGSPQLSRAALNNGSAIVVETDDALITQNLVAGYLTQNKFNYEIVPAPAAAPTTEPTAMASAEMPKSQSLGSVVSKLRSRDETPGKVAAASDEAYLLARNIPADKAAEISKALAAQRGGRQQARFYDNAELYPELRQQAVNLQTQFNGVPTQASAANAAANDNPGGPTTQPFNSQLSQTPFNTDPARRAMEGTNAPGEGSATQPTTLPTPDASLTTDVLIVVRSDNAQSAPTPAAIAAPDIDAAKPAIPEAADAQPAEAPPSTVPSAPATQPATLPSTQPVP